MVYATKKLGVRFTSQQMIDAAKMGGGNVFARMLYAAENLGARFTTEQIVDVLVPNIESLRALCLKKF